MFSATQKNKLGVRILLGIVIGLLGVGMLLYLVPQPNTSGAASNDVVATVGSRQVTVAEVREQLDKIKSSGQMPPQLAPLYAQQIIQQLVVERMMETEAQQLGITVTDKDIFNRVRQLLPTAVQGDTFVGLDRYSAEVQARFQMGVEEFEELVRQSLVQERVQKLVTAGVSVSPDEVQEEFRRRNEKVKLDYVVVNPDTLSAKVEIADADLNAYFEKNKARYSVPEKRVVRYALVDMSQVEAKTTIPDADLHAYYKDHLDAYKVEDRVHVADILFKTTGKTDAEIAEIRKKAQGVLEQLKKGAKFEDMAKKYSEDTNKDSGGDLGWIVRGQTVAEFEKAAFALPKGSLSDLVQTPLGFHIIRVLDKETARTKTFDEVLPVIMASMVEQKATTAADDLAQSIGQKIRQTGKLSLDELAKQYSLSVGETKPLGVTDNSPELGTAPELHDAIFRLRVGELSQPIRTDRGYAVISVKEIQAAHQGTLAEVRDRVVTDYRHDKAIELAKQRAAELAKRSQAGENLATLAKAMGFEMKTSELVARDGSIPGAGSARQLLSAFSLPVGKTGDPASVGTDWVVFRVADHQNANPDDFAKQQKDIADQLLDSKRQLAFESFQQALETQMEHDGKLTYNKQVVQQFTQAS